MISADRVVAAALGAWLLAVAPSTAAADFWDAAAIEHAKGATIGVLQAAPAGPEVTTGSHFVRRGAGVHIGDGYLVTARHAVDQEDGGKRVTPNEILVLTTALDEVAATLVGVNAFLDIAVYRVAMEGRQALPTTAFEDTASQPGDEVFTVGYPLGWGPAVGFGRIGNPHTFLPTVETRLMQVDLSVCSGNSGGGLFSPRGALVGIVHAIIQTETIQGERRCSRFAFAVPGIQVRRIVTAIIQGAQPGFSRLGIHMTAVKVGTRWRVAVSQAISPASDAGVRKGDILLAIDDTPITDAAQLKNYLIEHTTPGQRVTLRVLREETERTLEVTLDRS